MEEGSTYQPNTISQTVHTPTQDRERSEITTLPGTESDFSENKPLALVGTPRIVDSLGLQEIFNDDIDGMKDDVSIIELWIRKRMGDLELEPTTNSYDKVLDQTLFDLHIDMDTSPFRRVQLLAMYLKGKMNL